MLLALIICHLSVFVAANPFHKYPFVFLLDVGNEELEKTNSEQIRVSVPGGSVALRYPAIGYGNTISHVRVSGIDFSTDLKANIVDGGPGNRYVVLVFMGNPGVPYDAVVTVQTLNDGVLNSPNIGDIVNNRNNGYQNEEDANNSAEDLSDTEVNNVPQSEISIQNSNAELMQSSSNVYNYADSDSVDDTEDSDEVNDSEDKSDDGDAIATNKVYNNELASEESNEENEFEGVSEEKDIHEPYNDDIDQEVKPDVQTKGVDDEDSDNDDDDNNEDEEQNSSEIEQYSDGSEAKPVMIEPYSEYQSLKEHNYDDEVHPQEEFQVNSRPVYQEDPLDYEEPGDAVSMDDDDDVNNGAEKYRDTNNNNYIDEDDSYAVAY